MANFCMRATLLNSLGGVRLPTIFTFIRLAEGGIPVENADELIDQHKLNIQYLIWILPFSE